MSLANFDEPVQNLLLSYMLADADAFTQCRNILKDIYFEDRLRPAVRFICEYADTYKTLPQLAQISASTGLKFDEVATSPQHREWFLDSIETFSRQKALALAVYDGIELIENNQGGELEKRIKDALSISIMHDLGTDYFANPVQRIENMKDNSSLYSTGWMTLDAKLFGGFVKGGLNIFAAGSGVGKSLWLQNIALNWALQGKNVVYISLELSEDLVANRFDAMLAGVSTKEVITNTREVGLKVATIGLQSKGSIKIKRLPESTTTANDIRAYLKEYEIKTGKKPDCLVIDYLDIMAPSQKIDLTNLNVKDKYVSEEVRALMTEWDLLGATASQLNRSSTEASVYDHSHIAGGISKIQTADTAFGILAPPNWKDQGKMQLQFLKTRSSSGVGQTVEFAYCPISMRITDKPDSDLQQKPLSKDDLRKVVDPIVEAPVEKKKTGLDVLALMSKIQERSSSL